MIKELVQVTSVCNQEEMELSTQVVSIHLCIRMMISMEALKLVLVVARSKQQHRVSAYRTSDSST